MKTIFEYIEDEYSIEINLIEESILDNEEETLEKIDKDLQKALNIVTRAESQADPQWISELLGRSYYGYASKYKVTSMKDSWTTKNDDKYCVELASIYSIFRKEDADKVIENLKKYKCFTGIVYKKSFGRVEFKYNKVKDTERKAAIESQRQEELNKMKKYREEVEAADTSRFTPDAKNILKMQQYQAKGSDPMRVAKACGDDKLIQRWLIAMGMGWNEAVKAFKYVITGKKILSPAEIEAYENRYKDFRI